MKGHNIIQLFIFFLAFSFLASCNKEGDDLIDNSTNYPFGWKADDNFNLIAYNVKDSIRAIRNTSVVPFGTSVDGTFGTFRSSVFCSYQTTLTSKTFNFASIDSVVLVVPYYLGNPSYGAADRFFSVEVYEMTEGIDTDPKSSKMSYQYNPTALGSILNFIPNYKDSITILGRKEAPAIRIPLSKSFADKLVAPGSYTSEAQFKEILKGLYIRSASNSHTNGFIMLSIAADNMIKIYGKNSSGEAISSEFSTGGSSSTTINEFLHDNTSIAYQASISGNAVTGDQLLYNHGLTGYYNILKLPDLSIYTTNKTIFKAELTLFSKDTGYKSSTDIALMFVDSSGAEGVLPDEIYHSSYIIGKKDTMINGNFYRAYRYNIAMFLNRLITRPLRYQYLKFYSAPLFFNSNEVRKYSDYLPSRMVIGGTGHEAKPRLKIYYTDN